MHHACHYRPNGQMVDLRSHGHVNCWNGELPEWRGGKTVDEVTTISDEIPYCRDER